MTRFHALTTALLLSFVAQSQAQILVELDARVNGVCNPVPVVLSAGCWEVEPINQAWNAWGNVVGCNTNGVACPQGWMTHFALLGLPSIYFGTDPDSSPWFATPQLALANSASGSFVLDQTTTLRAIVTDPCNALGDNLGGLTLRFTQVLPPSASVETVRLGSPPNPNALLPGQTSAPIAGGTWDPVIDHTSFAPNATLDLLLLTRFPSQISRPFGTILCDLGSVVATLQTSPGIPFNISVPAQCSVVGLSGCSQGASFLPGGGLVLTNALDVTIGTF